MDIYAYKRSQDFQTAVCAALNKQQLEDFVAQIKNENYTDRYETDLMMHLSDPEFQPFQSTVFVFEHESAEQQDAFIKQNDLLVGTAQRAVDRQIDMVNYDAPDHYDVNDTRTIEQIYGLDVHDKWDKRSEEQIAADAEVKKKMQELEKEGKLSGDSFSAKKNSSVHVTDIRTTQNADGTIDIDNVLAVKVDTKDEPNQQVLDKLSDDAKDGHKVVSGNQGGLT